MHDYQQEDILLLKELKGGDVAAFERLFLKYAKWLNKVAYFKCGEDSQEAEDVVQEVFTRLWERRSQIDEQRPINSYLFISVRNAAIHRSRKKLSAIKYLSKQDANQSVPHPAEDTSSDLSEQIRAAIDKLDTSSVKTVITKYFIEGKKHATIIKETGLKKQTVHNLVYQGVQLLKKNLKVRPQ